MSSNSLCSSPPEAPQRRRQFRRGALLAAALAAFTTATAAETLPAPVADYVEAARLTGSGRLNWFGLHVYDAHLYAGAGFDARNWSAQSFVLELTYARSLEGAAIAAASRDEMQRLQLGTPEQHVRWLAAMRSIFPDVDRGRRIAGVHLPGRGARFYVDGVLAGSIDEADFARAFFAIWLDPRTRVPRLRDSLLASANGAA